MAIQDTGLGWYADSAWLSDVASAIGTLTSGSPTPQIYDWSNQPIPVSSDLSRENILQNGFQYGWGDNNAVLKVMSKISGVYVFTDGAVTCFFCDDPEVEISLGDIVAASSVSEDTTTPTTIGTATVNRVTYSIAYPLFFDVTAWIAPECRNKEVAIADALGLAENAFTPIPTLSALTASDIINNGLAYTSDGSYTNYIGTTRSDMVVYRTTPGTIYAFCTTPNSDLSTSHVAVAQTGYGYTRSLSLSSVTYNNDVYYYLYGQPFTSGNSNDGIPIIPYDPTEVAEIIAGGVTPGVSVSFAKSTAGYSVVCMCKWKSELGGDVYCSPFLISSAPNNTLYTRNSAIPSVGTTEHTFSGMTFYMRKAPLDVLGGTETVTSNFPILDYSSGVPLTNDMLFALIASASSLGVGALPEDDPYSGAGESGPDAGDPSFDFTSEDIPVPSIPSIGAFNTGFINMYKPSVGDLRDLAHYLWSGSFDPENLRKLIANPMDAILGLHIVPATASHPAGSSSTLYVGNIDTQLSMLRLTEQYYELDCGTVNIEPKWGAYLDYAPYSKLTLYLPYVGFVPISPDDCMGGAINVKYHVDVLSGACCVYVYCTSNRGSDSHVLYSYTGACACDCPVTEGQYTNAILGILNIAGSVAGAIASGITGNAGGVTGGIENAANAALSMVKPDVSRSGSFGGSAGLMGIQYPYLVLTVPRMCTPEDQQKQEGYPSFVTKTMSQLTGYNQVQVKRLEGMTCTANESEEILTLLEGGAIF